MTNVDRQISKAIGMYEGGREEDAMAIAEGLLAEFPLEAEVWKLRADLFDKGGFTKEAIADLDRAVKLNPKERMYLFRRAWDHLQLGNWPQVISDCTLGMEITAELSGDGTSEEEALRNEYYADTFLSLRAEAFLSLGRKREAKADLVLLTSDGGNIWTNQLRTKREMLRLCE